MITITIGGEPRGKGRPRFTRRGIAYTPARTRAYELDLRYRAQEVMNGRAPIATAVSVNIIATFAVPQSWSRKKRVAALHGLLSHISKPDWENIAKVLDALNSVVFVDDKQIIHAEVIKAYGEWPSLCVVVRPS
jgi:Holliday junction resolvase RusA-like endonuclease